MTNKKNLNFKPYGLNIGIALKDIKEIKLLPATDENLEKSNSFYPSLPEDFSILEHFSDESLFFYKIEQFDHQRYPKRELVLSEEGIGVFKKGKNHSYMVREIPQRQYTKENGHLSSHGRLLSFDSDKHLIVTTRVPESHVQLYAIEDCVICSSAPYTPNPVYLDDNTVLGKVEGNIQDISGEKLALVLGKEGFQSSFKQNDLPLISSSSKFELSGKNSLIICNTIVLKSTRSRPTNAQPGQLIYNARKKCFEGFDGTKWRPLKWGDE
tara:strand:- start:10 stop:813 length:804 start_codon:yes stop_codon:yes gene_type:complete